MTKNIKSFPVINKNETAKRLELLMKWNHLQPKDIQTWMSSEFEDFRSRLKMSCPECTDRNFCMGGCPIRPEIVLCDKKCNTLEMYC